jgi:hypothetical protein
VQIVQIGVRNGDLEVGDIQFVRHCSVENFDVGATPMTMFISVVLRTSLTRHASLGKDTRHPRRGRPLEGGATVSCSCAS